MAYLEEFSKSFLARDYIKVLELWQEYCESDEVDANEIESILSVIKTQDTLKRFGTIIEKILPLVMTVSDEMDKLRLLSLIFDIQTTNSQQLWDIAQEIISTYFEQDALLQDKLRLVGLRSKDNFQGAISNLILLNHFKKGNFVLHDAGWGVGEIMDCSFVREEISVEFENLGGSKRNIPFKNAYKSLKPIANDQFLALRFSHPEVLGQMAIDDPVGLIVKILSETGQKNGSEIKALLSGIIIDEGSYSKWWQSTRAKLKKDPKIDAPEDSPKAPYMIRKSSITTDERIKKALSNKHAFQDKLNAIHSLLRDFPKIIKDKTSAEALYNITQDLFTLPHLTPIQKLSVYFLLRDINEEASLQFLPDIKALILNINAYQEAFEAIELLSQKKQLITMLREIHPDWKNVFFDLLLSRESGQLKDFLIKQLSDIPNGARLIQEKIDHIIRHPVRYPETFLWCFQKAVDQAWKPRAPVDQDMVIDFRLMERFFEGLLLLYATIEFRSDMKEYTKKIYSLITSDRFKLIRDMLKESDIAFAQEFLLLTSKCRSFTDHDQKILKALVFVAHPTLEDKKKQEPRLEGNILWATEASLQRMKEKIHHIGTVEMIENAREIEEARKHGDLRENSEYKFAQEKRARLQKDLQALSSQFQRARVITKDDVLPDEVGIGVEVQLENPLHQKITYRILGPWDADSDSGVLSIESKMAQALTGKKVGDSIDIKGEKYHIVAITSIFDLV